jgi:AcrR family transcriptional regulator
MIVSTTVRPNPRSWMSRNVRVLVEIMTTLDPETMAPGSRRSESRERRRQLLHDRLYETAIDLFVTRGYESTTMDDIAETAGVARATVFNHFSQKCRFVEEWRMRRHARIVEIIGRQQAVTDLPVADRLRRCLREMAEMNIASRRQTVVMLDVALSARGRRTSAAFENEATRLVEDGVRRGEVCPRVDAGQIGALLSYCYLGNVMRWISRDPAPFDLHDRLNRDLDTILAGILVQ